MTPALPVTRETARELKIRWDRLLPTLSCAAFWAAVLWWVIR